MSSLHELIYGKSQPSTAHESSEQIKRDEEPAANPPPPPKAEEQAPPRRRKRKRPSETVADVEEPETRPPRESFKQVTSTASRLLSVLYDGADPVKHAAAPAVPNQVPSLYPTLEPHSTRRPPKTMFRYGCKVPKVIQPHHLATEQQVARRKRVLELAGEWSQLRVRWQARRWDLRTETDVGGAIERALYDKVKEEYRRKKKRIKQESKPEAPHPDDVDTSEEEQEQILSQLTQGTRDSSKEQADEEIEEKLKPLEERYNLWELGFSRPLRGRQLQHTYRPSTGPLPKPRRSRYLHKTPLFVIGSLGQREPQRRTMPRTWNFFEPTARAHFAAPSLVQRRQWMRVAARQIVGGVRPDLDGRILSTLWNEDMLESFRCGLHRLRAMENGIMLKVLVSQRWKDPLRATRFLGLIPELQATGPECRIGLRHGQDDNGPMLKRFRHRDGLEMIDWAPDQRLVKAGHKQQVLITDPSVRFVPVPGAVPPVPPRPRDATGGLLFGPVDKYNGVLMPESNYREPYTLTVSSILTRLAEAHLDGEDAEEERLVDLLIVATEEYLELSRIQLNKRYQTGLGYVVEIPVQTYALAVAAFCSLAVNGLQDRMLFGKDSRLVKMEDESSDDEYEPPVTQSALAYNEREKSKETPKNAERKVFGLYEDWMKDETILLFSELHITFGLLRIAKVLPESSSEILSRSFDGDTSCRTPLERMRLLLEHLESNGMLVDAASTSVRVGSKSIIVGELEYALHQASECFSKSIERDPTEIDHHCWYLAALCASMHLSSGNRIGAGAFPFPSFYSSHESEVIGDRRRPAHEIRRMLPKFHDLRTDVAQAFRTLLKLARQQDSNRAHLAIASFLEWQEVVALLVGIKADECDAYQAIRTLHEAHSVKWALKENNRSSRNYLLLRATNLNTRLDALATLLECDPSSKAHWCSLARSLGTLGAPAVKDLSWWTSGRQTWWGASLLTIRRLDEHEKQMRTLAKVSAALANAFASPDLFVQLPIDCAPAENDGVFESWLDNIGHVYESKIPTNKSRAVACDDLLPRPFAEVLDGVQHVNAVELPPIDSGGDATDVFCCKLLIAAHVYGAHHDMVRDGVMKLALNAWDANTSTLRAESSSMRALGYLFKAGLPITMIVDCEIV